MIDYRTMMYDISKSKASYFVVSLKQKETLYINLLDAVKLVINCKIKS